MERFLINKIIITMIVEEIFLPLVICCLRNVIVLFENMVINMIFVWAIGTMARRFIKAMFVDMRPAQGVSKK